MRPSGGWFFPADPGQNAASLSLVWRPDIHPETVIIGDVPEGFEATSIVDPARLPVPVSAHEEGEGLHLTASAAGGTLNLWMSTGALSRKAAFIIPLDGNIDIRLHSLRRALRWLDGRPPGPPARRQHLSDFHRFRFVRMLRAVDGLGAGASRREIASVLFSRDVRTLSAAEWKSTSERRQLARLIAEANAYIAGGYLRILTGMQTRGHLFREGRVGIGGQVTT